MSGWDLSTGARALEGESDFLRDWSFARYLPESLETITLIHVGRTPAMYCTQCGGINHKRYIEEFIIFDYAQCGDCNSVFERRSD